MVHLSVVITIYTTHF